MNPTLVEVLRGAALESAHRGALIVVDADGATLAQLGDVDRPVFARSAVKALQALPLVESGAADRLGLVQEELAIVCASHNGEPEHVRTVAGMLFKAGVDASVLECGIQWPKEGFDRKLAGRGEVATPLHNNCSGKHAGFVCLGCMLAAGSGDSGDLPKFLSGYVAVDHPVMREVTAALQSTTGFDPASAPCGVDGCSIPTFGIELRRLARAFARFGSGVGLRDAHRLAARRLRSAVAAAPFMVAGSDRFDTQVMARFGERVFCKVGAEGVYCAALPDRGLGVAIKIDDGQARAAEVVMATVIAALVEMDSSEGRMIEALSRPVLLNRNGIAVGGLRPSADLLGGLV
ncbi:MAG: asparaginase [Ideonella sp.]